MSGTFLLKKRMENANAWKFGLPDSQMGGQEDHHIRVWGNCHPDFKAIPIGNPDGVKICVRRRDECDRRIGDTIQEKAKHDIQEKNGYHRATVNLYDPSIKYPVQKWNPQYFSDRRIPFEQDLLRHDYLKWPIKYNTNGIKDIRAPHELDDADSPYYQYGYSHTPHDNGHYGMRTESLSENFPEIKYDVTRLHQPYPIWLNEQKVFNRDQHHHDRTHFKRII